MDKMIWILWSYLLLINIASFALMGTDKKRAIRHAWRIPERTLFAAALAGGSLGSIAGMYIFRHKTRRWYFKAGMPLIAAIQTAIVIYLATAG